MADAQDVTGTPDSPDEYWGGKPQGNTWTKDPNYKGTFHRSGLGGIEYPDQNDPNGTNAYLPPTPSGQTTDVARYQQMGADAASRPAYQADYSTYNYGIGLGDQSRSGQQDALSLQAQAAHGGAPSAAEIAGKSAMQQSLNNQVAAAGSVRGGPMAQAAAYRNAQRAGASNEAQMGASIQAGRAAEMATARSGYSGAANTMRSGDLQTAGLGLQKSAQDIQNEQAQRQLNQQGQQFGEQLGWNTNNAALQAGLARQGANTQSNQFDQNMSMQKQQNATNTALAIGGMGMGAIGKLSDIRSKQSAKLPGVPASTWLDKAQKDYKDSGQADYDQRIATGNANHSHGDIDRVNPYTESNPALTDYDTQNMLDVRDQQNKFDYGQGPPAQEGWLDNYMVSDEDAKTKPGGGSVKTDPYRDREGKTILGRKNGQAAETVAERPSRAGQRDEIQRQEDNRDLEVGLPVAAGLAYGNPAMGIPAKAGAELGKEEEAPRQRAPTAAATHHARSMERNTAVPSAPKKDDWAGFHPPSEEPAGPRAVEPAYGGGEMPDERKGPTANPRGEPKGPLATQDVEKDANRRLAASPYAYRPEFTPPEQRPGEVNYGPMAQEMEKNPLTATIVKKGPNGLRVLDGDKMAKVHSGAIASLQKQIDEMKGQGYRYG